MRRQDLEAQSCRDSGKAAARVVLCKTLDSEEPGSITSEMEMPVPPAGWGCGVDEDVQRAGRGD